VVADVTGRYLFNAPINGTAEMVTISVVALLLIIFLGCGLTGLQFVLLAAGNLSSLCGVAPRRQSASH
jgi:hypothetical protein